MLAADLVLDIEDADATTEPGGTIIYSFEYANVGDEPANGILHASVPRGTSFDAETSGDGWTCRPGRGFWSPPQCSLELGELAAGAEGSVTFAVTVDADISVRTDRIYQAGSISGDPLRWDRNDFGSEWTPIQHSYHDLQLDLDSEISEVVAGGTINYTLDYANRGNAVAPGTTISLRLPSQTSFDAAASAEGWACDDDGNCTLAVGEVAAGAEGHVTFAVTLDPDVPVDVRHVSASANIADDGSGATDRNHWNNTGFERDRVVHQLPDLSVNIDDNGTPVVVGGTIVYTIDYANQGLFDATGVTLLFEVPKHTSFTAEDSAAGWVCEEGRCALTVGNLGQDSTGTTSIAVTVDSEPFGFWHSRILASVSIADDGSAGGEQSLRNNRDWESTRVLRKVPDLSLSLQDGDSDALPGGTIAYTLTWQNNGLVDATGAVIKMRLPHGTSFTAEGSSEGWTCEDGYCRLDVGTVARGASATATLAATVHADFTSRHPRIWGFASISDDGLQGKDGNWRNNWSFETTPVRQPDPEAA